MVLVELQIVQECYGRVLHGLVDDWIVVVAVPLATDGIVDHCCCRLISIGHRNV